VELAATGPEHRLALAALLLHHNALGGTKLRRSLTTSSRQAALRPEVEAEDSLRGAG
jgi:hypothetical protein